MYENDNIVKKMFTESRQNVCYDYQCSYKYIPILISSGCGCGRGRGCVENNCVTLLDSVKNCEGK